jgi:hypothetical protein
MLRRRDDNRRNGLPIHHQPNPMIYQQPATQWSTQHQRPRFQVGSGDPSPVLPDASLGLVDVTSVLFDATPGLLDTTPAALDTTSLLLDANTVLVDLTSVWPM